MGYILHNAIVVTSRNEAEIERAATRARNIGLTVLGPSAPSTNGYRTICVCPDGSKEGWKESDEGEAMREQLRQWMNSERHEDGSSPLEWFEAEYSNDSKNAEIAYDAWQAANRG